MADSVSDPPPAPDDPPDATLVFHEQADGRKAARLHGGKVVLVDYAQIDRVRDGEAWYVRLRHRDTFAIAEPVERVTTATLESTGLPLMNPLAEALSRLRTVDRRPAAPGAVPRKPLAPGPPTGVESAALVVPGGEPPAQPPPPVVPREAPAATSPPATRAIDIGRLPVPTDRVALFIDGANTDGAARAAGTSSTSARHESSSSPAPASTPPSITSPTSRPPTRSSSASSISSRTRATSSGDAR